MTRTFVLSVLISLTFFTIHAQEFEVRGKVLDSVSKIPMEAATVYLETIQDSVLITFGITNQKGEFLLEGNAGQKRANLFFSYAGYKNVKIPIALESNIQLGDTYLSPQTQMLTEVEVTAARVPITIKKDTLEFNADSFTTRPDATVEDVLKKLPGVEVDSDGKITVNGKEVNQVLVNGQVFFSTDPKVATKSLPKEIINKIQITDTKSKTQEYTGEDGDGETKTINLTIKEDKNKGYLGRASLGIGTDERYQTNGLLNYFSNKKRISLIASSNNINNSGFSFDEIYDMVGNNGSVSFNGNGGFTVGGFSSGFGQGITTSSSFGVSYANEIDKVYEANGNYFLTLSDNFNDERTLRENILPDASFFTDTQSSFLGNTVGHKGSAQLEYDLTESFRISFRPSINVTDTDSKDIRNTISTNDADELINSNETQTSSKRGRRNFSNELELIKKIDTIGSYLRLSFENQNSSTTTDENFQSERLVFGNNPSESLLDQETTVENNNDFYQLEFKYRQALNSSLSIETGYRLETRKENNNRAVFDFDEAANAYSDFNEALSSDFEFKNTANIPNIGLRYDDEKFRVRFSADYRDTKLENQDFLQTASFSKKYSNLLFNANVNYTLGRNKRLRVNYRGNFDAPNINQLQPIPNVSNPLNIVIGNPDLDPTISHRIRLNYNNYDWRSRSGLYVYMGINFDENRVANVTTTDEDFLRTTNFTNVNGNYDGYAGMGYSKQIKKDSLFTLKWNFNPSINFARNIGFTNGERLESNTVSLNPRVGVTYNYKEKIEIEPSYTLGYTDTKYSLDNINDLSFIRHEVSFRTTMYWPKNVIWGNDIVYNYNGNVGPGFDKDAVFWNMSLGYQFLNKQMNFKVLAYDLLSQNINTRRTTGQDFIQDFQGTVLQRYFMFSLSYKFDQFGGKSPAAKRGRRYR